MRIRPTATRTMCLTSSGKATAFGRRTWLRLLLNKVVFSTAYKKPSVKQRFFTLYLLINAQEGLTDHSHSIIN